VTGTHNSWRAMIARCTNSSHKFHQHYLDKGISVCPEWYDFNSFAADMGEREDGMTIERIDNSKGYYADNCRWATRKEQANNRSSNVIVSVKGEDLTLAQAADKYDVPYAVIVSRHAAGWASEDIISKPRKQKLIATFKGITQNLKQWSKDTGIPYMTLVSRFKKGCEGTQLFKGVTL